MAGSPLEAQFVPEALAAALPPMRTGTSSCPRSATAFPPEFVAIGGRLAYEWGPSNCVCKYCVLTFDVSGPWAQIPENIPRLDGC